MKTPLLWNTLQEAAKWLSDETDEPCTPRRILDAAARGQIQLFAVPPPGTHAKSAAEFTQLEPEGRHHKAFAISDEPVDKCVPVPPAVIEKLLILADARPSDGIPLVLPGIPLALPEEIRKWLGEDKNTLRLFSADALRVRGSDLEAHADAPFAPEAPGRPATNADAEFAALFDPVTAAALEKMFPAGEKWARWAERASGNGLKAARVERALFNPYRAGLWFLTRGLPGWDNAHLFRVLANNLPARSQDKRELLLAP